MSAAPRSRRRKAPAAHGRARPAKRWASAARRASRSAATRRSALAAPSPRRAGGRPTGKSARRRAHGRPSLAAGAMRPTHRPRPRVRSPDVRAINGVPFGLMDWIRRSMTEGAGPLANKEVFRHSDFIFQIIKGPNGRNDYHLDPYDEIFYQLKGTVWVHLIGDDGRMRVAEVREGGVLLVSAFSPHSPQRPPDSIGLVVERPRGGKDLDGIAWYCEQCGFKLEETWLPCTDVETQLAEVLKAFNADVSRRTCKRCGAVLPDPAQEPPWRRDQQARRA